LQYARQVLLICYYSIFDQLGKANHTELERNANTFLPYAL
jgi:hypothetical protein